MDLRLSVSERGRWEAAAKERGVSLSFLVRRAVEESLAFEDAGADVREAELPLRQEAVDKLAGHGIVLPAWQPTFRPDPRPVSSKKPRR